VGSRGRCGKLGSGSGSGLGLARAIRVRVRVHLGQHELDARRAGVASARRGQQLVDRGTTTLRQDGVILGFTRYTRLASVHKSIPQSCWAQLCKVRAAQPPTPARCGMGALLKDKSQTCFHTCRAVPWQSWLALSDYAASGCSGAGRLLWFL
jgi:hypothetical protein